MNKILKSIFLIIIYLSFLIGIANAQGFWVKFNDADGSGSINFVITGINLTNQIYFIGIENSTSKETILAIPGNGCSFASKSLPVITNGSLIYDVYLTDNVNYYYTSQGYATGDVNYNNYLSINWSISNISVSVSFFLKGDTAELIVPLPSALWLLGSGVIVLGLIRKKLLIC